MGRRHVGTPYGLCICPDMDGDTVFKRSNKLRHQFHVFYKLRHQNDRIRQVKALVIYLTLPCLCLQESHAIELASNTSHGGEPACDRATDMKIRSGIITQHVTDLSILLCLQSLLVIRILASTCWVNQLVLCKFDVSGILGHLHRPPSNLLYMSGSAVKTAEVT